MSEPLDPMAWNWINGSWLSSCWRRRSEQVVELVGPNGLLNQLTKNVLETALDVEMTSGATGHWRRYIRWCSSTPSRQIRDGQVTQPAHLAVAVGVDLRRRARRSRVVGRRRRGRRKFSQAVLTEIKNRGTGDVCIAVCDGLTAAAGGDQHRLGSRGDRDVCDPPAAQHRFASA